jgi:hypothetical protein
MIYYTCRSCWFRKMEVAYFGIKSRFLTKSRFRSVQVAICSTSGNGSEYKCHFVPTDLIQHPFERWSVLPNLFGTKELIYSTFSLLEVLLLATYTCFKPVFGIDCTSKIKQLPFFGTDHFRKLDWYCLTIFVRYRRQ